MLSLEGGRRQVDLFLPGMHNSDNRTSAIPQFRMGAPMPSLNPQFSQLLRPKTASPQTCMGTWQVCCRNGA